jgi:hypothetical protein
MAPTNELLLVLALAAACLLGSRELTNRIGDQRHRERDERDGYECEHRERHHESDHLDGSLARLTCQDSSGSFWRFVLSEAASNTHAEQAPPTPTP